MPYRRSTDEDIRLPALNYSESEIPLQQLAGALRQASKTVSQATPPEEPTPVLVPEMAMAASAPGSEYWLP
jgi:hypothetical protein